MNLGFWEKLKSKKPFFALAPMADVTDAVFRRLIAKYSLYNGAEIYDKDDNFLSNLDVPRDGGPDVFWTEFVSADGLAHHEGRKSLLIDLAYSQAERPIVAQIFGSNPDNIEQASGLALSLGFDGVDINMGCPDRSVEKQGAGAGLIKNHKLAKEIIRSAKKGAKTDEGGIPVSVKTRIGYNKNEIDTWARALLEEDISALTMHLRTRKEMSLVPARWEHIEEIVKIKEELKKDTLIIGNGDIVSLKEGREKALLYGADGVMVGRGIFGTPWFFSENFNPRLKQRLLIMIEHTKLFEKLLVDKSFICSEGGAKNFAIMKKHYKAYVNGFDGAKELRVKLMEAENAKEIEGITLSFIEKLL